MVGSEGVLGVICEATLRVRPAPKARRYEGWSFASFAEGCDAFRVMEQAGAAADVNRLSDEDETRLTMALGSTGSAAEKLGKRYLRMRGHEGGCLAILGFEGEEEDVEDRRRADGRAAAGRGRGVDSATVRARPGMRSRYAGPVPARRAARPRRDGGDARDGDELVEPRRRSTRAVRRRAARPRWRSAGRRRS